MKDDILKKLREAGIPTDGKWTSTTQGTHKSPILEKQKDLLEKLESLLVLQVEKDKQLMADMQQKLSRLKHGGGN